MEGVVRDLDALTDYLDARLSRPFAWGLRGNDCVSFGLGAVKAQTGRDLARELGVEWHTAIGAKRVLRRLGGIQAVGDRVLTPVSLAQAMRGDLALIEGTHGPILMVVEGASLAGPGPTGAMRVPRAHAVRAWSIDI